jgi:hypothetical protein
MEFVFCFFVIFEGVLTEIFSFCYAIWEIFAYNRFSACYNFNFMLDLFSWDSVSHAFSLYRFSFMKIPF